MIKAEPLFYEVITDKRYGYELVQDLSKMFTTAGEFNSESILKYLIRSTNVLISEHGMTTVCTIV